LIYIILYPCLNMIRNNMRIQIALILEEFGFVPKDGSLAVTSWPGACIPACFSTVHLAQWFSAGFHPICNELQTTFVHHWIRTNIRIPKGNFQKLDDAEKALKLGKCLERNFYVWRIPLKKRDKDTLCRPSINLLLDKIKYWANKYEDSKCWSYLSLTLI
jgi:hypothetical protein